MMHNSTVVMVPNSSPTIPTAGLMMADALPRMPSASPRMPTASPVIQTTPVSPPVSLSPVKAESRSPSIAAENGQKRKSVPVVSSDGEDVPRAKKRRSTSPVRENDSTNLQHSFSGPSDHDVPDTLVSVPDLSQAPLDGDDMDVGAPTNGGTTTEPPLAHAPTAADPHEWLLDHYAESRQPTPKVAPSDGAATPVDDKERMLDDDVDDELLSLIDDRPSPSSSKPKGDARPISVKPAEVDQDRESMPPPASIKSGKKKKKEPVQKVRPRHPH